MLLEIIRYADTNSVEATWIDADGNQIKCQSYDQTQMDMLRADLGVDVAEYADIIATVEANIVPPAPPTAKEIAAEIATVKTEARAVRTLIFNALAGMQSEALALGNTALALSIADLQQGLKDLMQAPAVEAATTADECKLAISAEYYTLVSTAHAEVVSAFAVLQP